MRSFSSSFELFVVSFMQEDIDHTASALTLGLYVFSENGDQYDG